jgi:hypothetical protein
MKLKNLVTTVFASLAFSVALTADFAIPTESLGALGVFVQQEELRIYSRYCANVVPASKADFEAIVNTLTLRVQKLGAAVLATESFREMTTLPVSPSMMETTKGYLENARRRYDVTRVGASLSCKEVHELYRASSDDHWKTTIATLLANLRDHGQLPVIAPAASSTNNSLQRP